MLCIVVIVYSFNTPQKNVSNRCKERAREGEKKERTKGGGRWNERKEHKDEHN